MNEMRLDVATVRAAAQGRWPNFILPALGIEVSSNPRKHRPCPSCGGVDRFRLDDRDGSGSWYCNQCIPHSGDGFSLVMSVRRCAFHEALRLVAEIIGIHPGHARSYRPLPPAPQRVDRRALAFKYELASVDLRLRAEGVAAAAKDLHIDALTDAQLDLAIELVAKSHADIARAELFESVADGLRLTEFLERKKSDEKHRAA